MFLKDEKSHWFDNILIQDVTNYERGWEPCIDSFFSALVTFEV